MILLLATLLACGGDPELDPFKEALASYDEGRVALEAGDTAKAMAAFDAAAVKDPGSPELEQWRALAREQAGQDAEALEIYEAALGRFPRDPDLRYNRAALAARRGDVDLAAKDLRFLYARDLADPVEVGEDGDFAALIEDPDTSALVPVPQLWLEPHVEEGAVLLGASWTVRLRVESPRGPELTVKDMGPAPGLLRPVRVVEDVLERGTRTIRRDLVVEFEAAKAGKAEVGPWLVAGGATSAMTHAFPVEVIELPGRDGSDDATEAGAVVFPSTLLAGHEPPWVGRVSSGRVALGGPDDELSLVGADHPGVELELREAGQIQWRARLWPSGTEGTVEVRRREQVIASDAR